MVGVGVLGDSGMHGLCAALSSCFSTSCAGSSKVIQSLLASFVTPACHVRFDMVRGGCF
jgi:hypothetical protein